ncbi:MAG TPA: hypothetical protein VHM90_00270, partial [Phycisphaerae bacterium]|nr:hypothetical protein [Phycisphaerae bacterium]
AGRNAILPQSSHTGTSSLRFTPQQGRVSLAGLALPVREHPRSGEYRFVTFAWRKDGGGRIALQFDHADESQDCHKQGRLHGYRFDAGDGAPVDGLALRTDGKAPQAWWTLTRDLWHDFGDFTVTGLTFICPDGDAAQFDSVYLGQSPADFANIVMVARDTATQPSPIMARQTKSRE